MASTTPAGLECPGCGEQPVFLFGGGTQAFCGNDNGCPVITWNPEETAEQFWASAKQIDLSGGGGDP